MGNSQIVAMGGMGAEGRSLFRFFTGLTTRSGPRICLVPTASADSLDQTLAFYELCRDCGAVPAHLTLFNRRVSDIRAFLLAQDAIFVGGGNTASMLAVWRAHGVDTVLREACAGGIVLGGPSAGANCWFEASITDSFGPALAGLHDGLGLLSGSFCPHYDGEVQRRPTYTRLIAEGFSPGYAADDGVGMHFRDGELAEVVSARPGATAYQVDRGGENPLDARALKA